MIPVDHINTSWDQIRVLEESTAKLTPTGWVFPKWLILMKEYKTKLETPR